MKIKLSYLLLLIISYMPLFPHGIQLKVTKSSPFITVHASYSGGKVISNCNVEIKFNDNEVLFQNGNTDQNGYFCFKPDVSGSYTIVIDDNTGHKKSTSIQINDLFLSNLKKQSVQPTDKKLKNQEPKSIKNIDRNEKTVNLFKILFGLTLILFLTLLFYTLKKSK